MACKIKNKNIVPGGGSWAKTSTLPHAILPDKHVISAFIFNTIKSNAFYGNLSTKFFDPMKEKETSLANLSFNINDRAIAIGKRVAVIDKDNFGPTDKERKQKNVVIPRTDLDALRLDGRKYWTTDDNGENLIFLGNVDGVKSFEFLDFALKDKSTSFLQDFVIQGYRVGANSIQRVLSDMKVVEENVLFGTQQWVLIQDTQSFVEMLGKMNNVPVTIQFHSPFTENKWEKYVKGGVGEKNALIPPLIVEKKVFYDHTFKADVPFSKKELKKFSGLNSPLFVDVSSEYNFLIKDYENSIKEVPEILIPNMYIIFSEIDNDEKMAKKGKKNANTYFDRIITLNGALDPTPFKTRKVDNKKFVVQLAKKPVSRRLTRSTGINNVMSEDIDAIDMIGEYFDNYALRIKELYTAVPGTRVEKLRIEDLNALLKLNEREKHIGIPISNLNILNDFYERRELFPMWVDFQFSTDKSCAISQMLENSRLSSNFILNMMNDTSSRVGGEIRDFVEATEYLEEIVNENGTIQTNKKILFNKNSRRSWNITDWLKKIDKKNVESLGVFLDKETDEIVMDSDDTSSVFLKNFLRIIFAGKLRKLVKDKFRTYEEMINGKEAYSEVIFYRIEKKLADKDGNPVGNSIQDFYLPNTNKIDIFKFVDTQVKYGVSYAYSIYAYYAVIGTKYHYDDVSTKEKMAWFKVIQEPSVLLIEIPYFNCHVTVIDDPPVAPDVDLIPYKGVSDEILMFLNGGTGDYLLDPILIEPFEKEIIDSFRKVKGYDCCEKIRYKADDFVGLFQIYRIEEHPSSYADFSGGLIAAVQTDIDVKTPQGATAAAFRDSIVKNKKYWYCFRAIDFHGHISTPSPVFQLQMIDNKGTIFPLIDVVDFKEKRKKELSKSMRRFMYIKPTLFQTLVNESKSGIENVNSVRNVKDVFLGLADQNVFGKKYLIRVTSKQTGKLVEFLINFEHNFVKSQ